MPNAGQFGFGGEGGHELATKRKDTGDRGDHPWRNGSVLRRHLQRVEQRRAHLFWREGGTGATDGQDRILTVRVCQARGDETAKIGIADRLAGGEGAIAEHQVGLARTQTVDLTGEGFEEGCRAYNAVGHPGCDERVFKCQFGVLEGEARFLNTNR